MARQYAIDIKRYAIKRSIIIQASRLLEQAYDNGTPLSDMTGIEIADVKLSTDESGIFSMENVKSKVLELLANGYEPTITNGWPSMDKFFKTKKGLLNVWTGAPSSGKSELLDDRNIKMMNLHGWKFCYFSPENYPTEFHVAKLLEKIIERPFFTDAYENKITSAEVEKGIDGHNDYFRFIFPTVDKFTLEDVLAKFKLCIEKYGIDAVVLDPWNKIGHNIPQGMTEKQYISRCLDMCMDFARRNNVEFNIVAHPTKLKIDENTGEYSVAKAYDINGASEWFDKPDDIISVYRRYKSNQDKVSVYIQKVRHKYCGVVGGIDLEYNRTIGTYSEYRGI
jgi:twinkle protein